MLTVQISLLCFHMGIKMFFQFQIAYIKELVALQDDYVT